MAEGAQATPTPPAPPKKRRLRKILKVLIVLFALLGATLLVLPTVASATFLRGVVRGQLQAQVGPNADVGKVSFGWTTGVSVDSLLIPSGGVAKVKDRNAVELERVRARVSVPALVKAAATGGEAQASLEVENARIYLELHPDGKINIPLAEGDAKAAAKPEPKPESKTSEATLPCSALSTVDIRKIDLEIADMTSSTGVVQRIVLRGLNVGLTAALAKDLSAKLDTLAADGSTVAFDDLTVTREEPGKAPVTVIAIEKPTIVARVAFAGREPPSAAQAPMASLAAAHRLDGKPLVRVARVHGQGFDLRDLAVDVVLEKAKATLQIAGILKGAHEGKVRLAVALDLGQRPKLPVDLDVKLETIDVGGPLAGAIETLLPVLSGASNPEKLPPLTLGTKGTLACVFAADESVQREPTLRSIKDTGELALGSGSLEGSRILEGFASGFKELGLEEVLAQAMGGKGLSFDAVKETFSIEDGTVTIPKLELSRDGFGLALAGKCSLEGRYEFAIHLDPKIYARLGQDAGKLLKAVDDAGGIGVAGVLGGECKVAVPPSDVLAKALLANGAVDIFRTRNPKAAAKLDGYLGKAGTSVEKVVEDPKKAAEDAAKRESEKQVDKALDKNKDKIEKKTGVSTDEAKKKLRGLFGGD